MGAKVPFMELPDVPAFVRAELARQRKSQQALQERLGHSRTTMHRSLSGQRPFDADELVQIADFLGVTVGDLFGERAEASA